MSAFAKPDYWKYKVVVYVEARSTWEFEQKLARIKQIAAEKEMEG